MYREEVEDPVAALMKGYERLQACATDSLLKKYLTEDVFEALKRKTTTLGATLLDCINSGMMCYYYLAYCYIYIAVNKILQQYD